MMNPKENFEFMNSDLWLKYTHERYLGQEEIRHRVAAGSDPVKWEETWQNIIITRKVGAVPLFMTSIDKKFWYFPSDSIQKKIIEIERLGLLLYDKIVAQSEFKESFLADAEVEEAISSAIYEGANTTRAQAKQLIESGQKPASKDDWMLLNNFEAMNWIKENHRQPLTVELILTLHQIVTKHTLDEADERYSGRFRDDAVYVHSKLGKRVHEGVDWTKVGEATEEAIRIVTAHPRYLHPLIKGILLHYLIAYVHPFFDGNGRTARTLFYFKSMKHDLKFVELLSISAHLKNSGNQYEKAFEKVKAHDWDLTFFIDYCLESLLVALRIVQGKVDYLISFNALKEELGLNENQIGLLQRMALNKYRSISIEGYAAEIKKSREYARQELKALAERGLLKDKKQGNKLVYWVDMGRLKELVQEH